MGVKKPGAGGPGAAAALGGGTATSTGNEAIDKACREARDLAEQLQQQMTQAERSRVTERQQLVDKLETRDAEIKSIKEKNASVSYYYCYYYIKQKWSKNIDDRPHRRGGGGFFTADNVMWHRPVGSLAVGYSSRAVMPLLRIG